jgi:hypothetical protein
MSNTFKIGGIIWRGYRYWNDISFIGIGGHVGWNTTFVAYRIIDFTPTRIKIALLADSINGIDATEKDRKPLFLNRATMEGRGKQYHTRYHEYFYAVKPERDPELRHSPVNAIGLLDLPIPYSESDVRRAYKRLARTAHPDHGGTEAAFIELKQAHDEAMRSATT